MSQEHDNTSERNHHLTYEERLKIEKLLRRKCKPAYIATAVGCSKRTVERERKRGMVTLQNSDLTTREEYSATVGQKIYDENATHKGTGLKVGNDYAWVRYIEERIKAGDSPYVAQQRAINEGKNFKTQVSVQTIYNYIDSGEVFTDINNQDLRYKRNPKREYKRVRTIKNPLAKSISERPLEINDRSEVGHWEGDHVVGKLGTKPGLLTMTERQTRYEQAFLVPDLTGDSVREQLADIEENIGLEGFRETFKSITFDNGSAFLDFEKIENSDDTGEKRTQVYFAHCYCSWERGSNENANRMLRRFFPKGTDFSKVTHEQIQAAVDQINDYPRQILGGLSARMAYDAACENASSLRSSPFSQAAS